MDVIYYHPLSGGKLYQSGAMEIPGMQKSMNVRGYIHAPIVFQSLDSHNIALVALTAKGFQPALNTDRPEGTRCQLIQIPFADDQNLNDAQVANVKAMVEPAAKQMAESIKAGQHVLSTCWAGVNRSSLLTAFILKNLDPNLSPQEIMNIIREQRHISCLNNKLFVELINYSLSYT